jgi:ParB family transcriptional regulator, chromosome partitioning protein
MQLAHIAFGQLKISALNMRHGRKAPDISDILPSVRTRGILQPLLVRPEGEGFEIVAGRRRYFCAKAVVEERGEIEALPCAIMEEGDDAAALEASLIENVARRDPDEMTQYEAFARLVKEGRTVADIAQAFGIAEIMVKRRLALGNLLPKIRDAYRKEEIDPETIRHLTLASKAQQKEWLGLFEDEEAHAPRGDQLKQWLFGGGAISTKVALFPLEEYQGQIVADLFGEDGYFSDAAQFWERQNAAIAARRAQLLAKGWGEVVVLETGQHFRVWEHRKTPRKQGGKVYVTVSHRGEVEFHEGYLSAKEALRKEKNGTGEPDRGPAKAGRPELTSALQSYVDLHRHGAVRLALLDHPGAALRLMVAHVIGGSGLWQVKAEPRQAKSQEIAASLAASAAEAEFKTRRTEILALLESADGDQMIALGKSDSYQTCLIFARLLTLSDEDVRRALALVMAETLEASTCLMEAVGFHLKVDLSQSWRPDDTFFDLIRERAVTNALLDDVAGKAIADANLSEKTKLQRQIIRDCLAGANGRSKIETWLPRWMTFPPRSYTDRAGFRPAEEWNRVANLFA